jgi:hypothetical protein
MVLFGGLTVRVPILPLQLVCAGLPLENWAMRTAAISQPAKMALSDFSSPTAQPRVHPFCNIQ